MITIIKLKIKSKSLRFDRDLKNEIDFLASKNWYKRFVVIFLKNEIFFTPHFLHQEHFQHPKNHTINPTLSFIQFEIAKWITRFSFSSKPTPPSIFLASSLIKSETSLFTWAC